MTAPVARPAMAAPRVARGVAAVAAVLLAALPLAGPAGAQSAADYRPRILSDCLDRAEPQGGAEGCIGTASAACVEAAGADSTAATTACLGREAGQWDGLLNEAYGRAQARLHQSDAPRALRLRDVQRAWIAYSDAVCGFEAAAYAGGSAAGVAALSCRMRETGRRAIDLRALLADEANR